MAITITAVKRKDRNTVEPPSGWPDATNTGYLGDLGDLTALAGYTVSTPGTLIELRNVTEALVINAANVTIRDCVLNAGYFGVDAANVNADNLLIEDCTIIGGSNCGVLIDGVDTATIRRCNFYGGRDGIKIGGTDITVEDNYVHDLDTSGVDPHNDGIQCATGTGFIIRHNWIASPDTSCIAMFEGQGVWSDVLIEDNYFTGQPSVGWCLYCGGTDATGLSVLNNTFDDWGFGPVSDWSATGNTWSGNVRADNGATITP